MNSGSGSGDPVFDRAFNAPQYFMHATMYSSSAGDIAEDTYFLFPTRPDERGVVVLPDGYGGSYWRLTDYVAGPFGTPRSVCGAAASRGATGGYSAWNHSWGFDCSQLAAEQGSVVDIGDEEDLCAEKGWYGDDFCDDYCMKPDPDCGGIDDTCQVEGFYGDGVCDDFCKQPDPDCDPGAQGPSDASNDPWRDDDGPHHDGTFPDALQGCSGGGQSQLTLMAVLATLVIALVRRRSAG